MRDCVTVSGVGGRRARAAAPRAGRRAGRCAHPAQMSRETEKALVPLKSTHAERRQSGT